MSFAHTSNALRNESLPSIAKLVLSVVADFANKYGQCWPSVTAIAKRASLSIRTVQRHLNTLLELGLLRRLIRNGRSSFFTLHLSDIKLTPVTVSPPPPSQCHPEAVIEAIKEITAATQFEAPTADADVVVNFEKQEAPTAEPPSPVKQPGSVPLRYMASPSTAEQPIPAAPLPELVDVPQELIEDFGEVRKTKKRGPKLTRTEARALKAEADKAGFTVAQAIMTCVLRGWSHFKADWVPTVAAPVADAVTRNVAAPVADAPRTEAAKAAGLAALAALRAKMRPADAVTALPEPVADTVAPLVGPSWAVAIVNKCRNGQHVNYGPLETACKALGLTVASCRR